MTETARKLYFEISDFCPRLAFMANCIFTGDKPTRRMKCLLARLKQGDQIGDIPYTMPQDGISVNGTLVRWDILLDKPDADPKQYREESLYCDVTKNPPIDEHFETWMNAIG
jgi:hypothetical protein